MVEFFFQALADMATPSHLAFLALGWAMGRAYFRSLLEMLRARSMSTACRVVS